jgi:cell division septum initiation protein DivIVA
MCYTLRYITSLLLAAVVLFPLSAQTPDAAAKTTPTLQEQFDAMVQGSNRYQQFRVVPQTELNTYIKAVADTLATRAAETAQLNTTIAKQSQTLTESGATVATLNEQIAQLEEEKDGISLLGALVSKATYNIVLWTIILAALAGLVFFFLRSRLAVSITQGLRQDKEELVEELAAAKKRRLEVEQDLRRKLQDEINKRGR